MGATTEKLRYLIATACKDVLGVTFNSIHIKVVKLENSYSPDVEGAEKYAKAEEQKQICKEACELVSPPPAQENPTAEQAEGILKQSAEQAEENAEELAEELSRCVGKRRGAVGKLRQQPGRNACRLNSDKGATQIVTHTENKKFKDEIKISDSKRRIFLF